MSQGVRDGQLRRIADVIEAGANSSRVPGRLADPVLRTLAALVPCDSVTFGDLEPATGTHHAMDEVFVGGDASFLPEPVTDPGDVFWLHYGGALHCSYPTRTGDDRTVTMRSDFYSTREWLKSPMYVDVLSEWRVTFEIMCPLPSVAGRSRRLIFFRSGAYDFTEEDRFALALLRPHLTELVGRRQTSAETELTERQTQLLRLVAEGLTNAEIASALHLSPHTVRTHLTNIFERLGVTTRAAAVARVFSAS